MHATKEAIVHSSAIKVLKYAHLTQFQIYPCYLLIRTRIYSEADENTSVVHATKEAIVHSSAHASLTTEAEETFKQHGGEDQEVDARELMTILNDVFTKGWFPIYNV